MRNKVSNETVKSLIRGECANYQSNAHGKVDFCWCSPNNRCVYFGDGEEACQYFEGCVLPLAGVNRTLVDASVGKRVGRVVPVRFGLCLGL